MSLYPDDMSENMPYKEQSYAVISRGHDFCVQGRLLLETSTGLPLVVVMALELKIDSTES